ncbi:MAG: fimbrillin family protein [Bacteroidales bacterium]|nr:fimbrillin family protein [Bacteroidales bacterium]
MKKILIFAATAAVVLASCARTEDTLKSTGQGDALTFGVYAGRIADTKATYGDIDLAALQGSADGFGVFAYYTEDDDWADTDKPNFMFNQQVAYNGSANTTLYPQKWEYTPIKYWPNGQNSTAVDNTTHLDKVSFFAYAPYTAVTPASGATVVATAYPADGQGVISTSANNDADAPTVTFVVPDNAHQQIDLLYATPIMNVTKQTFGSTINFAFHHALAKINPQVQAVVDAVSPTTNNLGAETTIILQELEVTLNGTKKGTLNLEDGSWTLADPAQNSVITYTSSSFASTTTVDSKTGFNVTETATDLNATKSPMVIPTTIAIGGLKVQANYWVITADSNLVGGYSTVQNVIYTTNASAITLAKGKKYNIVVRLGLNSIDFNVYEVDAWSAGDPLAPVDLPLNS